MSRMARRLRHHELNNPTRPLVCVDLNGVLDRYTGWQEPDHWDPPREGADRFLEALSSHGYDVVVFTTRHRVGVRRWLHEHGLMRHVSAITNRKPPAHVFIDDRAVCFRGDFDATLRTVLSFTAHWEDSPSTVQRPVSARSRARNRAPRARNRRPSRDSPSD